MTLQFVYEMSRVYARLSVRGNDFDHLSRIVDGCAMITIDHDVVRQRAEGGWRQKAMD